MQIARKALEPPDMLEEEGEERSFAPAGQAAANLTQAHAGAPQHWSAVRCGCIEGVLATAILAGQHADVWEAASMLLREHYRCSASLPIRKHARESRPAAPCCGGFRGSRPKRG